MPEAIVTDFSKDLQELGIEHSLVDHPATKSISDVLNFLHLSFSDCLPTLVMKADDGFLSVVFRGDCKVDFKKIKKTFVIKDLRMATPEEYTHLTGLPIGAARVYTSGAKTIIDLKVFEKEYLLGGSGAFDCSIKYKTEDLKKLPVCNVVDISKAAQNV